MALIQYNISDVMIGCADDGDHDDDDDEYI